MFDAIVRATLKEAGTGVRVEWRIPNGRAARGDVVAGTDDIPGFGYADVTCLSCLTARGSYRGHLTHL